MLFAAIEELPREPTQFELVLGFVSLFLALAAVYVFLRLIRQIGVKGPQVRHDLFTMPEMLAGAVVLFLLAFFIAQKHFGVLPTLPLEASAKSHEVLHAETPLPMDLKEMLLNGMIFNALMPGVVIGILLIRGARLSDQFGFTKKGFFPTIGLGVGLGLLAASLTGIANMVAQHFMKEEAPQMLIQRFKSAATGNDLETMLLIGFSAVVAAPIIEEFLFRGIFYPTLARGLGRIPSAVVCSAVFAFAHDTYMAVPGLMLLALLFTLVYEATGSLLVPIVMHVTFNSLSLGLLWYATNHGIP